MKYIGSHYVKDLRCLDSSWKIFPLCSCAKLTEKLVCRLAVSTDFFVRGCRWKGVPCIKKHVYQETHRKQQKCLLQLRFLLVINQVWLYASLKGFLEITPVIIPFRASNLPSEPRCISFFLALLASLAVLTLRAGNCYICSTLGTQVNPILISHLQIIVGQKERPYLSHPSIVRFRDHHQKQLFHALLKIQCYVVTLNTHLVKKMWIIHICT